LFADWLCPYALSPVEARLLIKPHSPILELLGVLLSIEGNFGYVNYLATSCIVTWSEVRPVAPDDKADFELVHAVADAGKNWRGGTPPKKFFCTS
jgi:hypothetical protein